MLERAKASRYVAATVYGALVFSGTALLGFVVAPWLALAGGLFSIDAEARSFFSLLTLKGVPCLVGLSVLSAVLHPGCSGHGPLFQVALLGANVLLVWLIGAASAFAILG
jgi:hypothetical protein